MTPLRKIVLNESIQLGPKSTQSVDVNDPYEPRRRDWAGIKMELNEATGLVKITFRGQELFLHMSACRYAQGLDGAAEGSSHTVTRYDPQAQDDEPAESGQPWLSNDHAEDPDEFDDPPPAPKPAKRKPGRPKKAQAVEEPDEE